MLKTYIKCTKCDKYAPYADSFCFTLQRNSGSAVRSKSVFQTYICESCAYKYMTELGEETNDENDSEEETKD